MRCHIMKLFKTVDLRDVSTNECIIDPVQTNLGLMERGIFDALKRLHDGRVENAYALSVDPDQQALRAALLTGGTAADLSYYDADALQASFSHNPCSNDLGKELQSFSREALSIRDAILQYRHECHPSYVSERRKCTSPDI